MTDTQPADTVPDKAAAVTEPAKGDPAGDKATAQAAAAGTDPAKGDPAGGDKATAPAAAAGTDPAKGDPAGDKAAKPSPMFTTDWRESYAGGDEAKLNVLKRYSSPKEALDALFSLREKLSAGPKQGPGKDAKPEEIAAYRKEVGIPETATEYLTKGLPEGVIIGEQDMPMFEGYAKKMHDLNVPPAIVHAGIQSYFEAMEINNQARQDVDVEIKKATEDTLREEWGSDYRENIHRISNFVAAVLPQEIQANFLNARLGDGNPVFSDPHMVRAFATLARDLNPTSSAGPGIGGDKMADVEAKLDEYHKRMGSDPKGWSKDMKAQEHYRQLIDFQVRNGKTF